MFPFIEIFRECRTHSNIYKELNHYNLVFESHLLSFEDATNESS
jgi:hypothetical protein